MEHNKKSNTLTIWIFGIAGILVALMIVWLTYHFISSKKNSKNEALLVVSATPVVVPTDEPLVTPTIVPSSKSGLKTFIFSNPTSPYSFEYPATWGVVEIAHDNIVRLNYAGHCRVELSTISAGNSINTKAKVETRAYAGRTFQMTTLKKTNSFYSESLTLNDATSKDGFSTINVDLPASSISQCQQTVDQILASFTFGK